MPHEPKVTIITPSYNTGRTLAAAVESALAQTFQDFELIILDDGSSDDTAAIGKDYAARYPDKVRYIYQENKGLAAARNTAIAHARGEYLALLDADDVWLPRRLEATVAAMDAQPKAAIVHANITRISPEDKVLDTPARDARFLNGRIFEHIFLRQADLACPTVLFRKSVCEEVGGFDEYLSRLGCEDRDLWCRMTQEHDAVYVDEVLAHYRVSANSMSRNLDKMLRARRYVVDKLAPEGGGKEPLRRRALSRIYRDLGDVALLQHDFPTARGQYRKALTYDPVSFWAWINFFKALFRFEVKHAG